MNSRRHGLRRAAEAGLSENEEWAKVLRVRRRGASSTANGFL